MSYWTIIRGIGGLVWGQQENSRFRELLACRSSHVPTFGASAKSSRSPSPSKSLPPACLDVVTSRRLLDIYNMAQYDLTKKILPYLDRHLGFPLLLNPSLSELYKPSEVQSATYELAKTTDLVDFALNLYEQLHPGEPAPPGPFQLRVLWLDR